MTLPIFIVRFEVLHESGDGTECYGEEDNTIKITNRDRGKGCGLLFQDSNNPEMK